MSRVGKNPISIPEKVKVEISGAHIKVKGPQGELSRDINLRMKIEQKDSRILIIRSSESKQDCSLHGLTRSLIANMITGVTDQHSKELEIHGMGYRAQLKGHLLSLLLGYSHPIDFSIPEGIKIEVPKPTRIVVKGIDKQKVHEVAAKIRRFYEPEPYKGKGVRYAGEYVRRKQGKAVA
ncbi:MAG: 50S ribosomal protein L6 [Candidatus Omnitrophota bacterium]|nr:50S ribosomal protein L6 [Candidatus Omnitrophota bacterium]